MKYIVTGGAGFVGSHIADELVRQGHEVIIIDNLVSGEHDRIRHLFRDGTATFVEGSVTDLSLIRTLCAGADGIFHEAAVSSVSRSVTDPIGTNDVNITGTLNVLIAARDAGVRKIVFASSSSVYGDTPGLPKSEDMAPCPRSPYAVSKLAGEQYLSVFGELYGMQAVSLRYFNVFGPGQSPDSQYAAAIPVFILRILNRQPPVIYGDGGQTRDFVYVKDVVSANIRAMESGTSGVFNIACCRQTSIREIASMIMEITGIRVPVISQPSRRCEVRDSVADMSRAKAEFGYLPGYSLFSGLTETVGWFRDHPAV